VDYKHQNSIATKPISKTDWEEKFQQKAKVLWFTGLSGSGKTTLSLALEKILFNKGHVVKLLDGDALRSGINTDLGFSLADRKENIRRVAEIAKLFAESGFIVMVVLISPTQAIRNDAKRIIGAALFYDIYIDASLATCEQRDVKGLYKKARTGEIQDFTGISAPYEVPMNADVKVSTENVSIEVSVNFLYAEIFEKEKIGSNRSYENNSNTNSD
jgi:adenylylsulfate kinase